MSTATTAPEANVSHRGRLLTGVESRAGPRPTLFPLRHRQIFAQRCPGIELTRPAQLLMWVFDHFFPLRDPADGAGEREEHREHRGGETHRAQRDAGVEIDIRVKLLLDEIFV